MNIPPNTLPDVEIQKSYSSHNEWGKSLKLRLLFWTSKYGGFVDIILLTNCFCRIKVQIPLSRYKQKFTWSVGF